MIPLNQINCLHGKLSKNIYKTLIKFWKEPKNIFKNPLFYKIIFQKICLSIKIIFHILEKKCMIIKSQRAIQMDKGKISLDKSPKISKHINKKAINGTHENRMFK